MTFAYSAKIRKGAFGWRIEILHWPAGLSFGSLREMDESWALTHRGAVRKAQRMLRRRRARRDRREAALDIFE